MDSRKVLITGGAGFIGSNLADALAARGHQVTLFDNLSRRGAAKNLAWLRQRHHEVLHFVHGDCREFDALVDATRGRHVVYHLAGQTAVTSSVVDPRGDFEANALGTFNALEAARLVGDDPIVLLASTNKVYGRMEAASIVERDGRYEFDGFPDGIPETQPLDFHSPYGCSKGAADQYARDYARIYGLRSVVLRQSCIYGQRQMGIEDQGWVAWFVIAAVTGRPITIYGDGKQVRDLLHIDDLLRAYDAAVERIDVAKGQVYNIGGGPRHTLAVWTELGPLLGRLLGREVEVAAHRDWRPGDQPVFVSDIQKAERELGWRPIIGVEEGIQRLIAWVQSNRELFDDES
ncbi:MAG: NAD-dependent epimerase/dehydratase family protein [Chloroflexi bacterium]|nr:NAD-dependent epimerase/dehydratase family protein [Chloroflexota bacterium]